MPAQQQLSGYQWYQHHKHDNCNMVRPHQFRPSRLKDVPQGAPVSIHHDRNSQPQIGCQLFRQFPAVISMRLIPSPQCGVRFACRQRPKLDGLFQVLGKLLHGFGPKSSPPYTFEWGLFQDGN
jgi:hypothetical protein